LSLNRDIQEDDLLIKIIEALATDFEGWYHKVAWWAKTVGLISEDQHKRYFSDRIPF